MFSRGVKKIATIKYPILSVDLFSLINTIVFEDILQYLILFLRSDTFFIIDVQQNYWLNLTDKVPVLLTLSNSI